MIDISEENKIILKIIADGFVEKPEYWQTHRRSKNYFAHIIGLDPNYKFSREFLQTERYGRKTYFRVEDFYEGDFYELVCIYYSAKGNPHVMYRGFLKCVKITEKEIILEPIDEEEIIEAFKADVRTPEFIIQRLFNRLLDMIKKTRDAYSREIKIVESKIKELQEKREYLKKLKEILKKEMNIVLPDAEEIRKKAEEEIKNLAEKLIPFGSKKFTKEQYKTERIHIKKVKGQIEFVRVNGVYVISQYDTKPSIKSLYNAIVLLREELEKLSS